MKATTLRDSIARRLFADEMVRRRSVDSERIGEAWASPSFDDIKQLSFRLADDILDIAEVWVERTSDGRLSTARTLKVATL
jgi:hypothetical protein